MKKGFLAARPDVKARGARKIATPLEAIGCHTQRYASPASCSQREDSNLNSLLKAAERLLISGHVSAASRAAFWARKLQSENDALSLTEVLSALEACDEKEKDVAKSAMLLMNRSDPPIDALLELLRHGVEGIIWERMHPALERSLGHFTKMLQEVGLLSEDSLLLQSPLQQTGQTKQVYVLASMREYGGTWVDIPCSSADPESIAAQAAGITASPGTAPRKADGYHQGTRTSSDSGCAWRVVHSSAWPPCEPLSPDSGKWAVLCSGDWVEMVEDRDEEDAGSCVHSGSWPAMRCAAEFLHGMLPRISFNDALGLASKQKPAVVRAAHLMRRAEARWSLEFLAETSPDPSSPEASRFSVYRAREPYRRFRYAGRAPSGSGSEDLYDMDLEECAEQLCLDFRDFAKRKRAAAQGRGDGYAYYLWGVALRRAGADPGSDAGGDFEGFNFGPAVDEDLAEEGLWQGLDQLQKVASWGRFRQAQIFVGCENALTPCHYDMVHNAYVQVRGWKRFLLVDPCYSSNLYAYPQGHPMDRCAQADLESPDFTRFPKLKAVRAVEAVLGPGDLLLLPAGWWHHVQSLSEDSISVSFWFDEPPLQAVPRARPLTSFQRVQLAREAERMLLLVLGTSRLRSAMHTLRTMLGCDGESGSQAQQSSDEVLACAWLLWRLCYTLESVEVARSVALAMADDARMSRLKLCSSKK
ncbi:Hif1an [Symbiodinium sp. CCMP2592]|nr:Hif1an [Symbiodinium sp. CCMP2592]